MIIFAQKHTKSTQHIIFHVIHILRCCLCVWYSILSTVQYCLLNCAIISITIRNIPSLTAFCEHSFLHFACLHIELKAHFYLSAFITWFVHFLNIHYSFSVIVYFCLVFGKISCWVFFVCTRVPTLHGRYIYNNIVEPHVMGLNLSHSDSER